MQPCLTVSELNRYIKSLVEQDDVLLTVSVCGEISNFKPSPSGHYYFTVKDSVAALSCVMFRSDAARLGSIPQNGDRMILFGNVSFYEKSGNLQLYVRSMIRDGIGDLARLYEERRKKFTEEGLFDQDRKKTIPPFPKRIGVVTSPTGAVIHDIINVTQRRYPFAEIVLYPAAVQGENAVPELCAGIAYFNAVRNVDVLLVGRGGGSLEDLWAFNEEETVRAVAGSDIPVISCVGHETDTTLCDFAADLRAPTPSAAAEQAVPDTRDILLTIDGTVSFLRKNLADRCALCRSRLETGRAVLHSFSPQMKLNETRKHIDRIRTELTRSLVHTVEVRRNAYRFVTGKIESLSPMSVLRRGYAALNDESGRIVSSVAAVVPDECLTLTLSDGLIRTKVLDTERK